MWIAELKATWFDGFVALLAIGLMGLVGMVASFAAASGLAWLIHLFAPTEHIEVWQSLAFPAFALLIGPFFVGEAMKALYRARRDEDILRDHITRRSS